MLKIRESEMLKFYFNAAPNPNKVALFLEESGLPFEPVPVDTRKGDQFKPEFLKVNPNGKVQPSTTKACSCSTPMRSCFTSPRRPASSCRPAPRATARNYCHG